MTHSSYMLLLIEITFLVLRCLVNTCLSQSSGAKSTTIDCEGIGRAFYFHSGESSASVVSGFTIINGSALDAHRGAICCIHSSGPTIEDNIITDNKGGGIYCNLGSSPSIRDNTIGQNSATFGGAICSAGQSRPVIYENRVYENRASDSGGGIYSSGRSYVEIQKNEIIGNVAGNIGGGICAWDAPTTISDNIIIGNSAGGQGGGIRYHEFIASPPTIMANNVIARNSAAIGAGVFYQGAFTPAIVNSSISGNIAGREGGGIFIEAAATATVLNTVVWANSPDGISFHVRTWVDVAYSDIQETWPGEGNIMVDPLFVDADNDDYRLSDYSPCISAGTGETKMPNRDILGNPRPYPSYSKPDMGAYESPLAYHVEGLNEESGSPLRRIWILAVVGAALAVMFIVGTR